MTSRDLLSLKVTYASIEKNFRLMELMANVTEMLYEKAAFETLVI